MSKKPDPKIIILGGGTAGWMTANLLQHTLSQHEFTVTLIESPDIGIIGVGEGSTPHLKVFFDTLGIEEQQWMPKCNATYKNGITFKGWSLEPGFEHYFHPFPSRPDRQTAGGFLINSLLRRQGHDVDPHPNQYFLSAYLAKHFKHPKTQAKFPLSINYGYHFDSALLGEYLKRVAIDRGVKHIEAKIDEVKTHLSGDIQALIDENGHSYTADWFVDCSGFAAVLLQKTLGTEFVEYKDNLFNDAAVAIPSAATKPRNVETISTAMSAGWSWDIPLTNRTGNGYVYSTQYIEPEQAELELRSKLGLLDAEVPVKHLKMRVGCAKQHWVKNCLAVGLSQGFIEPLEATALHLVLYTVETFISAFTSGQFSNQHQAEFNQLISSRFEGIRDYIVCHYKVNSRNKGNYWLDNANNKHLSDSLLHILDCWDKGGDLTQEINRQNIGHYYPAVSWHCLLAGYGRFPPLGASSPATHDVNIAEIQHFIRQCAQGFLEQGIDERC
ncbi:tryptophan halogenase family protein [Aliiglaciecola sp. M165]|uniref:tryptophan halogenase family protein n=1 Tax=Aliiglaciecola sp. M165 TaxID=2593649 RepID=UPI0021B10C49|nr:tryptophan halogenase family protein [Aliiglaciecola sp. M165]